MTHEEMNGAYELYALGALDPEERNEIDVHLERGCPECGAAIRRARELTALFAALPEQAAPPRRLRNRVLAAVGAPSPARRWAAAWAVATVCLAAALIVVGVRGAAELGRARAELRANNESLDLARRELQANRNELVFDREALRLLNEPDTFQTTFGGSGAQPPRGRVFVNPRRGVLLLASHLPPVAAGRTLEMWVVPKTGAPRPAGLFLPDPQGNAIHLMPGAVDRARTAAIAVSVEPRGGSSAPTTKPFLVAGL